MTTRQCQWSFGVPLKILAVVVGFCFSVSAAHAAGENWLSGYGYRKQIIITGSTAGTQTNYQMKMTVNTGSGTDTATTVYLGNHGLESFADVRFTADDGNTLLDYWIESISGSAAIVWVEVPSVPASPDTTPIYLYYGNGSASSASSGANTFSLFDDFNDGSIDTSLWTVAQAGSATYAESGGYGRVSGSSSGTWVSASWKSKNTFGPGYALRTSQYLNIINPNMHGVIGFGNASGQSSIILSDYKFSWAAPYYQYAFQTYKNPDSYSVDISNPNGTWNIYDYLWTSNRIELVTNGTSTSTVTDTTYIPTNTDSYAEFYIDAGAGASGYVYTDWLMVRKYTYPEPTMSFGSESVVYTLSYSAGANGSVTGSVTQYIYTSGGSGTAVTAVPDNGYVFSQWSDGSTSNPRTDTNVTESKSVTAQFTTGYTVTNPPANTTITLSTDNTDVTTEAQTGSKTVYVGKTGSYQVATFDVSFTADRDWSSLTTLSNGTKTVFHYPGGYTSLPGHVGTSYSLLVRDLGGTRVRICPGASTLDEVAAGCSGEYFVTTASDGVSKTTIGGINYWVVGGLTGSGGEDLGGATHSAPLFDSLTLWLTLVLAGGGGWWITSHQMRVGEQEIE